MSLHFDVTGDNSNFLRKLEETKRGVSETAKFMESQGKKIDSSFNSVSFGDALKKQIHDGSQSVNGLTAQIIKQKAVIKDIEGDVRALGAAYRKAGAGTTKGNALFADFKSAKGALQEEKNALFGLQTEQAQARLSVRKLKDEYSLYHKEGQNVVDSNNQMAISFKKTLAAIGGTAMIKKFVSDVVRVRGEFQQLDVAFTTLLQSKEKANALMAQMVQTAAKTPFNLTELATGARQLVAYGFQAEDINGTLIRLGNIASGLGLPLERLTYLYGTSMTQGRLYARDLMQFTTSGIPMLQGLADMYGVSTAKVNEMVTAGKIGFPEVQKVVENLTNEGGKFFNLMEEQSKTITGKISNLGDAMDGMFNSIGQANEGVINDSIDGLKYLVENYEQVGRILLGLVATYGVYKAATITYYAITKTYGIYDIATKELQFAATMKNVAATKYLAIQQAVLNKIMLANPYALVAAAISGVAFAIYKVATAENEFDKATKRLNEATTSVEKSLASEVSKLTSLERKLEETKKGTEEYSSIKKTIIDNYGQYYKGLDGEIERVGNLSTVYGQLVEAMRLSIGQRKFESFFKAEQDNLDKTIGEKLDKAYDTLIEKYGKDKGGKLYQQVFDSVIRGNAMPADTWKQLNEATFKEWGFDNSPVGFSIRSVSSLMSDVTSTTQASSKALDEFKEKYQITEEEVSKILSGSNTSENKSVENKTLKQLLIDIDASKSKIKKLQEQANKGLISSDKIKEEQDALAKLTSDYKNRTGKEHGSTKELTAADKLREQQEKLALLMDKQALEQMRSEQDLWNEVWQAQIDSMDEGSEKTLAQMELNHKKELQILDRQKEDLLQKKKDQAEAVFNQKENEAVAKNPNHVKQTFDGSGITLDETTNTQFDDKYKAALDKQAKERQAYFDAEKQAMNEYLAAYGDYEKKREAIIAQGEEKKKGKNVWEQKSVDEETKKVLSDLDVEVNKKTSAIGKLFDDMKDRTVKDMRSIADAAEQMLSFINSGTWDESQGIQFGISKETFDTLRKSPQELESIKNEIANVRKEADASETAFNKVGNGLKKVFSAGDDTKKLKEGLEEISQGMNDVMQAGQFLSDSLSQLGDALGSGVLSGIAEGLNVVMDAMSSTMDGAKAGAMFGPIGAAAGAAIGLVSSLASSIAKIHDAKNEKRITVLQDQIEVLEKSYDKLGNSVEKAYSKDASKLIAQQNTLLEQQKVLIRNQIAEERDKKKTDDGRIKEWEQQIEDINKLIGENKDKQIDAIFGEDTKSAIDNFAQAYADAWASNEDRTKSAKDVVKDMMRQMVTESIKAAIQSSQSMEKIRAKLQAFYADSVLSGWEQDYIYNMAESLQKELDDKFGWADSLMKGEEESTSQDSTKGMSQSMDQDTGNELNGRFTAFQISNEGIRTSTEEIKNSMLSMLVSMNLMSVSVSNNGIVLVEIRNLMISSNSYLEDIAKYTKVLMLFGDKLDSIANNTKGLTSR